MAKKYVAADLADFNYVNRRGFNDRGIVPGFLRGYCVEFEKNGEKEYNSCTYVVGSLREYYQEREDDWGDLGYEIFETCIRNGWTPTGNVEFLGYSEEYMDDVFGKWEEFIRDVPDEVIDARINESIANLTSDV